MPEKPASPPTITPSGKIVPNLAPITLEPGASLPPNVNETLSGLVMRKKPQGWRNAEMLNIESLSGELPDLQKSILQSLPKAPRAKVMVTVTPQAIPPPERFKASLLRTGSRFFVWFFSLLYFALGTLKDVILRRDTEQRRAARLLATFQRMGGTMIKLGQQLSMRADLLPYAYCVELSKLLDNMKPFPLVQAVAAVERAIGQPLEKVFAVFDPKPIGCASVACVYQAVLHSGEKVAVKVRRPGIGSLFAADIRAISWWITVIELLTLVRPGSLRNLPRELEMTFLEELDFSREARYQEIFRRNANNKKLTRRRYFSAPKLYYPLCNREVIVEDYVSGIWLWELLAAVELKDPVALKRMQTLRVDPRVVARRLMWISSWGTMSNLFFHADPHPANILVKENNLIVFVDFGACGAINSVKRNLMKEFFRRQGLRDVNGMIKAFMEIMEPLPPIDLDAFEKDLEKHFTHCLYAVWSKHSPWWERTSAGLWLGLFEITNKYNIPMQTDTLASMRATLLYDTLAIRLDNKLDPIKENQRFMRDQAELSGRRVQAMIKKRMRSGIKRRDLAFIEDMMNIGAAAIAQTRRLLDKPGFNFNFMINKSVFTVVTLIRVFALVLTLLGSVSGAVLLYFMRAGRQMSFQDALYHVITHRGFQVVLAFVLFIGIRRILFRLNDRDV